MRVPEAGLQPFQEGTPGPNMPFAPAKAWYPLRVAVGAGNANRVQPYQNSLACQSIIVLNEGGGDLLVGNKGVSLSAPAAGQSQPAFSVPALLSITIPIEDASYLWLGSVAGTTASVGVIGPSFRAPPGAQVSPPYNVVR
jgi:hypothetical protein